MEYDLRDVKLLTILMKINVLFVSLDIIYDVSCVCVCVCLGYCDFHKDVTYCASAVVCVCVCRNVLCVYFFHSFNSRFLFASMMTLTIT